MPIDFTMTIPAHLYRQAENQGQSSNIPQRIPATFSSGIVQSSTGSSSTSPLRNNVKWSFWESNLCQKIIQIWRQCCESVSSWFSAMYQKIFPRPSPLPLVYPQINTDMSREAVKKIYWGLGRDHKWMECVDGRYHHLGKYVFDRGTHAGTVEPGFIASMEETFTFIEHFLQLKVNADWYLLLHKHTCAHFDGNPDIYLMGQEKVGLFRDSGDGICCGLHPPHYPVSAQARAEFYALDQELKREFGDSYGLGTMTYNPATGSTSLSYLSMSQSQIRRIFNKFLNEFYQKAETATTPDQKLWAIAELQQKLEWLHPVKDGTARTSTAMMNKFLTDFGFHPAILEYPHRSSTLTKAEWKKYLQEGLLKWEQERAKLNP